MDKFILRSEYQPTGDQPEAIEKLVAGLNAGYRDQTLLGVTGSGKTFTLANVLENLGHRPTLVLSHNKTLAAQLYIDGYWSIGSTKRATRPPTKSSSDSTVANIGR